MGALPKPLVPDGPVRVLFGALHQLHHTAGWPSLRDMAREVGCSHTTISVAFSEPRVPRWGLLELIVETLGGDTEQFHRLWLAASLDDQAPSAPATATDRDEQAARPRPRELPAEVAGFTGRADQLAELDRLLAASDADPSGVLIAALSGTAGVGKTALAVHWAHRVADRFPDGQLYVNLRGYDPDKPIAPAEALEAFLRALGVAGPSIPHDLAQRAALFRTMCAGRRMLALLDNAHTVDQVRDLLPGGPSCVVLVTSRDTLPALVARHGAARVNLDLLSPDETAALLRRLIGVRAEDEPGQTIALAERCARLPLALRIAAELAAASPTATLSDLVADLDDEPRRLDLLAAGDDPYTAVRAVFSWSHRYLDPAAVRAFQLLGLHPGWDFDRYVVSALAGSDLTTGQRLLGLLSRAHLVETHASGASGMHDLLRAYAAEQAADLAAPEQRAALIRLFDYYRRAAAAAMDIAYPRGDALPTADPTPTAPLPRFADARDAQTWLDGQRANLLAVAAASVGEGRLATEPEISPAVALSATLARYLDARAYYLDALTLHGLAVTAARARADRAGEGRALNLVGSVNRRLGHYQEALDYHEQALAVHRASGDRAGQAAALHGLGTVRWRLGHYAEARDRQDEALAIFSDVGDRIGEGNARYGLGIVCRRLGRYTEAVEHYEQALEVQREIGDRVGEAGVVGNLGIVYLRLGRHPEALEHHLRSVAIHRELNDRAGEGVALTNLGTTYGKLGHGQDALEHHRQALAIFREVGYRVGEGDALHGLGVVHLGLGHHEVALNHLRQALAIADEIGEADLETVVRNDIGGALHVGGHGGEARTQFEAALVRAEETGDRYEKARALAAIGHLCAESGDLAGAAQNWRDAAGLYADLGVPEADELRALLDGARA